MVSKKVLQVQSRPTHTPGDTIANETYKLVQSCIELCNNVGDISLKFKLSQFLDLLVIY